jgi:hypothetical protein
MEMTEASQHLTISGTAECSEPSTTGNVSTPSEPVIHEISSDSPSTSLETSSSSSSDSDDDKPLGYRYPKLVQSHPTSTKTHKNPSQTSSYESVGHVIDQKLEEISERRNQYIDRILLHHPQPLNIQSLNMIVPDNVESDLQTTSEMAPEASASESPQHHAPEPQTTSSPQQPPVVPEPTVPEQTSPKHNVPEPTVPEHNTLEPVAPEQPVLEPTQSSTINLPDQTIQITRYDGVSITNDMDIDSEVDQDDQASDMVIDTDSDQLSTSQPLTTNGQSPTNLAIVPTAPPKPS